MIRLQIVVEGSTEERFINDSLAEALTERGVYVTAMKVLRGGGARGGGRSWQPWRRHLTLLLRDGSSDLRVSTFLDLYGIPKDAPGYDASKHGVARADGILRGIEEQIADARFIPYIQVHEFESLLFADPGALTRLDPEVFTREAVLTLAESVRGLAPEDVNEGYETAPSRRIGRVFAAFDKVEHGPPAAKLAGLPKLRDACPRFRQWMTQLESFGESDHGVRS